MAETRGLSNGTDRLASGAQPGGGAQVQISPADAPPPGTSEPNVSPEEQAEYEAFMANGMRLLNDEKGLDAMIQSIQADGNPVEGLANVVASIVMRVEDSAQKNGTKVSGDVLMHGGTELLEQAAEMAEAAGVHEFSEQDIESALYLAMDIYRTAREGQGKLPADQLGQDLQELQAAEQDGSLEAQFPGITERGQQQPAGPPAGQPQQRGLLG